MRILIRTSRLATWARRFGSFALPLAVIPIPLHRAAIINSDTFVLIETLAMGLAGMALLAGLAALVRLWITGDRGWNRASAGVMLGIVCLTPIAYGGYLVTRYPPIADITTQPVAPIDLVQIESEFPVNTLGTSDILAVFPDLTARQYPASVNETYRLIDTLVRERGWEIVSNDPPDLETADGQINALAMTLLGWRDEIAIQVTGDQVSARVDMRSASLAAHGTDLGRNGTRIEAFLHDLDGAVADDANKIPSADAPPVPAFSESVR